MAKTYNTFTSVATGDVLTATTFNNVLTNVGNYRVPPACHVYRSSDLSAYTQGSAITWNAQQFTNTDSMWTSGTDITIGTAGLYLIVFKVYLTATATMTAAGMRIGISGTAAAQSYTTSIGSSGTYAQGTVTYVSSLAAAATVNANVSIAGGSAYIIKGGASADNEAVTSLSVTWLGQVA